MEYSGARLPLDPRLYMGRTGMVDLIYESRGDGLQRVVKVEIWVR
jgi:hypothetical protein